MSGATFSNIKNLVRGLLGNNPFKLVLIIRSDLGMKKGKIASQCAHAAVGCYRQALMNNPDVVRMWESVGQPQIVLKADADGENCLVELSEQATAVGLTTALIRDAGRTQVETGSLTVLGIGPGRAEVIDKLTKHLKLL